MNVDSIAKHARDINAALFHAFGQDGKAGWEDSTGEQKYSKVDDVLFIISRRESLFNARQENPDLPPDTPESAWAAFIVSQANNGWTKGDAYDAAAKKHPYMMPYDGLPIEQKAKFCVFWALVNGLAAYL